MPSTTLPRWRAASAGWMQSCCVRPWSRSAATCRCWRRREDLSQALEVKAAHVEAIIKEARQVFDYVVLDVGRSIDTVSLKALDLATKVFRCCSSACRRSATPGVFARSFSLEIRAGEDPLGRQPSPEGRRYHLESMEHTLGGGASTIPNHFKGVNASVNQGIPIDRLAPGNPVARALGDLAGRSRRCRAAPGRTAGWPACSATLDEEGNADAQTRERLAVDPTEHARVVELPVKDTTVQDSWRLPADEGARPGRIC